MFLIRNRIISFNAFFVFQSATKDNINQLSIQSQVPKVSYLVYDLLKSEERNISLFNFESHHIVIMSSSRRYFPKCIVLTH